MTEKKSTRKKFLQLLGLSAGATLLPVNAVVGSDNRSEILKLSPPQQAFMLQYEQWMDEFIEVIRIQKTEPDNAANNTAMIALTERSERMKPELDGFLKDETFFKIYQVSIKRMVSEI